MNAGLFVRDDETLETMSKAAFETLTAKLNNSEVTSLEWGASLVSTALEHGLIHNSDVYSTFYQDLVEAIKEQIQTASKEDVEIASMLAYLDKIELSGFYPVVTFRPGILKSHLMDMEPTFLIYCQDDKLLPTSTPVLCVSVSQYGVFHFHTLANDWLKQTKVQPTSTNAAKPKAKKAAGKKTAKARG